MADLPGPNRLDDPANGPRLDGTPGGPRLDDPAVESRLARLDEVLGQLEQTPGHTAELALEAVETLTAIYGEALARAVDLAANSAPVLDGLTGDELLRHLLLLHCLHPDPVERRVARAIDDLRTQTRTQGLDIELLGVRDDVARVGVSSGRGGGRAPGLHDVIRELVSAVAPELSDVQIVTAPPAPALIPVAALWQGPPAAASGGAATRYATTVDIGTTYGIDATVDEGTRGATGVAPGGAG